MIDILILFESVALLLLMIIPGFLMSKFKLAPEKIGKGISNLILYITQPALIIHAYVREYDLTQDTWEYRLYVVCLAILLQFMPLFTS